MSTQIDWYENTKHAIRYWLLRRLPTCKQTVEVISQSMERRLTLREQVLLKLLGLPVVFVVSRALAGNEKDNAGSCQRPSGDELAQP